MTRISSEEALLDAALKSPSMEGFAMFELDMGGAIDPQTREPVCPTLEGEHAPLWSITSNAGSETIHQRDRERAMASAAEAAHKERVADYASLVASGDPLFEEEYVPPASESVDPTDDEWTHFWGGDSPTEGGYVPRSINAPRKRCTNGHLRSLHIESD